MKIRPNYLEDVIQALTDAGYSYPAARAIGTAAEGFLIGQDRSTVIARMGQEAYDAMVADGTGRV